MIGRFLAFKDKFGHSNVTRDYTDFIELYEWILSVRIKRQKNLVHSFQIKQLEDIDFKWRDHRVNLDDSENYLL